MGTSVVGMAGIAATYLSGKRQVSTARLVARDQAEAALRAQREERHQRRIEAAYPKLLDVISEGAEWLWRVDAFMTGDTDEDRPTHEPEAVKMLMKQGSLTAIWSPQVAELTKQWTKAVGTAFSAARRTGYLWEEGKVKPNRDYAREEIEFADVLEGRATHVDYLYDRFRINSQTARTMEAQIREQVWRELRGEDRGYVHEPQHE